MVRSIVGQYLRSATLVMATVFGAAVGPTRAWTQETAANRYTPVVMWLASPDEGARMFSLVRLLPPEHPETLGHDFPTLQTIHPFEVDVLVHLGEQVGLGLRPTLERHKRPTIVWPYYPQFHLPPVAEIRAAPVERRDAHDAPVPGLRAVAFVDRLPVAALIDTRGLSLEERGMQRATTSGLDIIRAQLDQGLARVASQVSAQGAVIVVFGERPE